jgi:hypothetical protein
MLRLVLIFAALALALTACKSQCRQLAEVLCNCSLNTVDQQNCLTAAGTAEGANPPSDHDNAVCQSLLPQPDGGGCDCRLIDTPEGKIRCGLARPPPDGGADDPGDGGDGGA